MKNLIFLIITLSCITNPSLAKNSNSPEEKASQVITQSSNYPPWVTFTLDSALLGNSISQKKMGDFFLLGKDVPQDYTEAKYWYKKASKDNPKAAIALANIYLNGIGEPQDNNAAIYWLSTAANLDSAEAQFMLADIYYNGVRTKINYHLSRKYFESAEIKRENIFGEQENIEIRSKSQYMLGLIHEKGHGAKFSISSAMEWYGKACDSGLQEGCDKYKRLALTQQNPSHSGD